MPSIPSTTTTATPISFKAEPVKVEEKPAAPATPAFSFAKPDEAKKEVKAEDKAEEKKTVSFSLPTTTADSTKPTVSTPLTASTTSTTTTTTSSTPATPSTLPKSASFPSSLKNKTLEDIVVGWNEDLETQVAEFQRQAVEIGLWDRRIIANGERLLALNDRVAKLEASQGDLEQSLNYVVAQQAELETLLDGIEKESAQVLATPNTTDKPMTADDREREAMYGSAIQAQERIADLGYQLASAVDSINRAASTGNGQGPLADAATLLNAHLEALQWIEAQVKELKLTTDSVQQLASKAQLEHQRRA